MMLRSLFKVIYSILESKYNCEKATSGRGRGSSGDKNKGVKIGKAKKKSSRGEEIDDFEDSAYEIDASFVSDDSRCDQKQALMETICAELDPIQISKVFLLLLSKEYVNANAAKEFQLSKDLQVEFFLTLCFCNATKLKKVAVVKEYLAVIVEHINLAECRDLIQLRLLHKYVEINNKMLIQGAPKLKKFIESLERKI